MFSSRHLWSFTLIYRKWRFSGFSLITLSWHHRHFKCVITVPWLLLSACTSNVGYCRRREIGTCNSKVDRLIRLNPCQLRHIMQLVSSAYPACIRSRKRRNGRLSMMDSWRCSSLMDSACSTAHRRTLSPPRKRASTASSYCLLLQRKFFKVNILVELFDH